MGILAENRFSNVFGYLKSMIRGPGARLTLMYKIYPVDVLQNLGDGDAGSDGVLVIWARFKITRSVPKYPASKREANIIKLNFIFSITHSSIINLISFHRLPSDIYE
ncbi:hypothetical protein AVEN_179248-1 [Araneus ventricosus]|uniref:Uncharacterized protein n=1 Tax=Araneus ventricosus TaxID=182803 RepID=A0A4Y2CAT3_ARAVE|nr:hypothetical protein AVEN_179248-1 [Araneus ventricosus]